MKEYFLQDGEVEILGALQKKQRRYDEFKQLKMVLALLQDKLISIDSKGVLHLTRAGQKENSRYS